MNSTGTTSGLRRNARIEAIDIARGVALAAMAIYHFAWDLEFFGYAPPGMTAIGGWKLFARCIASSFLFLVGVSLVLAHGDGIRWRPMLKRLAMVGGAALSISIVTYLALPQGFIFFGILHQIALASVLGLAFLHLPALLTLAVAALVIAAPHFLRSGFFDHPALWWVGLSTVSPRSNDYVPVFPWFGAVLAGIAAARLAQAAGLFDRLAALRMPAWQWPLAFAGRHSLAVYLIHQPILIGLIWVAAQIAPPAPVAPESRFMRACAMQCQASRDEEFCARYCACMLDSLEAENLLPQLSSGEAGETLQSKLQAFAGICTAEVELSPGLGVK